MKKLFLLLATCGFLLAPSLRAQGVGLSTSALITQDLSITNADLHDNLAIQYLLTTIPDGRITGIDGNQLLGSGLSGSVSLPTNFTIGGFTFGPEWSITWSTSVHNGQIFIDYTVHVPGLTWNASYYTGYRTSIFTEPTRTFAFSSGGAEFYEYDYLYAFYPDDYFDEPNTSITYGEFKIIDDDYPEEDVDFYDDAFWDYVGDSWNT